MVPRTSILVWDTPQQLAGPNPPGGTAVSFLATSATEGQPSAALGAYTTTYGVPTALLAVTRLGCCRGVVVFGLEKGPGSDCWFRVFFCYGLGQLTSFPGVSVAGLFWSTNG